MPAADNHCYTFRMDSLHLLDTSEASAGDYQAVKAIIERNGGLLSQAEVFSVTVNGFSKLARLLEQLEADGVLDPDNYYTCEEDKPSF